MPVVLLAGWLVFICKYFNSKYFKSLHILSSDPKLFIQPIYIYQQYFFQVICILGETLEPFDEDGVIPAFGFGDASTKDRSVFSFRSEVRIPNFNK